jgi:hypothetical protein
MYSYIFIPCPSQITRTYIFTNYMVIVDAIKPKIKEEYSRWRLYRSLWLSRADVFARERVEPLNSRSYTSGDSSVPVFSVASSI